ncbi:MAG: hypothetical protein H0V87_09190 [Chloroflexi bacterium]|nr:hypothetical protein [Chloroflexota bacterium]
MSRTIDRPDRHTAESPGPTGAERAALLAIVAVAAVLRFVDLPTRGQRDADQGHDMLVLRAFVQDGVVPLLGPPRRSGTSTTASSTTTCWRRSLPSSGRTRWPSWARSRWPG